MPKFLSFILLLLMSVAFTTEIVVAHKGITITAFAKEEEKEKETEEKKAKEDNLNTGNHTWHATLQPNGRQMTAASETAALPAGHHSRLFTPPDIH